MAKESELPLIESDVEASPSSSSLESFHIGNFYGIPVKVHIAFPVVFILSLAFSSGLHDFPTVIFSIIAYGPLLLATVLIHELTHCLAVKYITGEDAKSILLWPLGGLSLIGHGCNLLDDIKISIAGPLSYLLQSIFWWICLFLTRHHLFSFSINSPMSHFFFQNLFSFAVLLNFHLLFFNLFLPAYPLDGGRIMAGMLLLSGMSSEQAAKITLIVSTPLALVLIFTRFSSIPPLSIFIGFWILLQNFHLFSLIREKRVESHPLFGNTHTEMEPF